MGKINDISSYSQVAPTSDDYVIGSDGGAGLQTKNFLFSAIQTFILTGYGLQEVCDVNSVTTTGMTIGGVATITGAIDANSTADIADTLTLSKASGTGLSVTSNATIGGTLGVTGVSTLGEIDSAGPADIADTLTLSKPSGTALSVSAGAVYFASNLDVYGLHHQWGALTVEGITTLNAALDVNSTADISDTLTLSKASGTGLSVTSNATIGGILTVTGAIDANSTADIADTLTLSKASGNGLEVTSNILVGGSVAAFGTLAGNSLNIAQSTPASASATGITGTIAIDANYIYVCTATDTWKRVAIATW